MKNNCVLASVILFIFIFAVLCHNVIKCKWLLPQIDIFGEKNPLTNLIPDLKGVDPDDSFSRVPYEKGYTLLFYLETLLGGPSKYSVSYFHRSMYLVRRIL